MGLVAWPYKDTPLGAVFLGAGANIAAIALFFLIKELTAPVTVPQAGA